MRVFLTGGSGFIGTNLVDELLAESHLVRNFSLAAPMKPSHGAFFHQGDLLDETALRGSLHEFQPDVVVHLAARTECVETTTVEEGYSANTTGTANLLKTVQSCSSIRRAVIISSQYVCGPGRLPNHDEDYFPATVYGQSKVITEQLTKQAGLSCCWTLVRPTNIWGPWHTRYQNEFWKVASKGLYFHPGGAPVVRCYGYVGNIIWQMRRILDLPDSVVGGQTFYLSDEAADIYLWANEFCKALCGRPAPKVPRGILAAMAGLGDGLRLLTGRKFPITTSRYRSMTTDYVVPMEKTLQVLGPGPFSLQDGVAATVQWLESRKSPQAS